MPVHPVLVMMVVMVVMVGSGFAVTDVGTRALSPGSPYAGQHRQPDDEYKRNGRNSIKEELIAGDGLHQAHLVLVYCRGRILCHYCRGVGNQRSG